MNQKASLQAYRHAEEMITDPMAITSKVLEKSVVYLKQGRQLYAAGDQRFDDYVGVVQKALAELIRSLDKAQGDLPDGLISIYSYLITRLESLDLKEQDASPIDEATETLEELRAAWKLAITNLRRGTFADTPHAERPGTLSPGAV